MEVKTLAVMCLPVFSSIGCADEPAFDYEALAVRGEDVYVLSDRGLEFARIDPQTQPFETPETLAAFARATSGVAVRMVAGVSNIYFNRSEGLYEWDTARETLTFIPNTTRFDFELVGDTLFYLRANRSELVRRADGVEEVLGMPPEFIHVISFATDGHSVAWSTILDSWIATLPNGVARPLSEQAAINLAIHDEFVYFVNRRAISRVPLAGGAREELVPTRGLLPRLQFARGSVFWQGQTSIHRTRLADPVTEVVVDGDHAIRDFGISDEGLFYIRGGRQLGDWFFEAATGTLNVITL